MTVTRQPFEATTPDDDLTYVGTSPPRIDGLDKVSGAARYADDLDLHEIAEALNVPVGTVKSRLHHARQELRATLERSER